MSVQAHSGQNEFVEAARSLRDVPRSERVQKLFNFEPTEYQAELLDKSEATPKAQCAPKAGRQVGKTLTAGILGADHAVCHAGTDVLFAAPVQSTADEMFRECKQHFKNSDFTLEQFGVDKDNEQTWELLTGTRLMSRTLGNVEQDDSPGNRGMSPTCVIVDEAAYAKDAVYTEEIEEFFITHPRYEFLMISTPAGKTGYFYNAVDGKNADDWYSPHWPTRISPYAQQDFIEKKRRQLDSQTFRQEYLGEFVEGENAYLPHSIVKPCIGDIVEDDPALRYLGVDPARKGTDRAVYLDLDQHGVVRNIWSEETSSGPAFVGRIKALQRGTATDTPDVGTGNLPDDGYDQILIEENAVGGFGVDFASEGLGNVITPVTTSLKTKQLMYKRLKRDLESCDLVLPNYRRLITQLTSLEYSYTANSKLKVHHPNGGHDDFPDALAFANLGRMQGTINGSRSEDNGGVRSF